MSDARWMLYGANGYTGELIAEHAVERGGWPILAGRRADAIEPIAKRLGLQHRVFDLSDRERIERELADVSAVLLCAGPFSATSEPMVDACIATGTHYLDITGEIDVFEACHARDDEARAAGSVIMPGVGFDVVPSDCLAASLAAALPDADELELAFSGVGSPSKGTATTMVEGMPNGGAVREDGAIRTVPLAWKTRDIRFRDKARTSVTIPWGDVSTAFYSTGIANITVYMAAPPSMIRGLKVARPFRKVLGRPTVQRFLKKRVQARVTGPSSEVREHSRAQLWGRVSRDGKHVEATLETPEAYKLTVLTAFDAARRVARGEVEAGAKTPSMAFGPAYISQFDADLQLNA